MLTNIWAVVLMVYSALVIRHLRLHGASHSGNAIILYLFSSQASAVLFAWLVSGRTIVPFGSYLSSALPEPGTEINLIARGVFVVLAFFCIVLAPTVLGGLLARLEIALSVREKLRTLR